MLHIHAGTSSTCERSLHICPHSTNSHGGARHYGRPDPARLLCGRRVMVGAAGLGVAPLFNGWCALSSSDVRCALSVGQRGRHPPHLQESADSASNYTNFASTTVGRVSSGDWHGVALLWMACMPLPSSGTDLASTTTDPVGQRLWWSIAAGRPLQYNSICRY